MIYCTFDRGGEVARLTPHLSDFALGGTKPWKHEIRVSQTIEEATIFDMKLSRRQILQFSATLLGPGILDFLRTPTWRWSSLPILQASTIPGPPAEGAAPKVQFVDVAREAGTHDTQCLGRC